MFYLFRRLLFVAAGLESTVDASLFFFDVLGFVSAFTVFFCGPISLYYTLVNYSVPITQTYPNNCSTILRFKKNFNNCLIWNQLSCPAVGLYR